MRKPYSIYLHPYSPLSGGIKVMYSLYGSMLLKGEEIVGNGVYKDSEKSIAIYPEITHGNPLQAGTVVRYILNKPGVMTSGGIPGPAVFPQDNFLVTFSKMFMDLSEDQCLFLPAINTEVFYDKKGIRTKDAVFVGKGKLGRRHPVNAISIERETSGDQEQLADLLNECEALYTYDPVSAMTEIARLCGCRVVYLGEGYTKSDYLKYEPGINGMMFPNEDDDIVPLDSEAFERHYKSLYDLFWTVKLPRFINLTQNYEKN